MQIQADQKQADWKDAALRLRADLKFDVRRQGGKTVAVIEDPIRGRFFQIGEDEYRFISRFDGQLTVGEILEQSRDPNSRYPTSLTESMAQTVCNWLVQNNFLLMSGDQVEQRLVATSESKQNMQVLSWLNPISLKISLGNPDRLLQRALPFFKWMFSLPAVIAWLALGCLSLSLLSTEWERFASAATGVLAPSRWIWLLIAWIVLKIIHEIGHGICCKKYGGEVKDSGALFLLFAPLAYVDVTSSWRFSNRWQRICVSAAGMYVELAVAFIAVLIWCNVDSGLVSDLCYNIIIMASLTSILFNANPLMRFDGYYILADTLNVVNLYNRGREWFWKKFDRFVLGIPFRASPYSRREQTIVAAYGFGSTIWKVFLTMTLLLAASTLFHGLGLILALLGGVFWVIIPIRQQIKRITALASHGQVCRQQVFLFSTFSILCVLAVFFVFKAPTFATAPAIVKHKDEQVVRAKGDGFLREVFVEDGQHVEAGDPILRLENEELENEAKSLSLKLAAAQVQSRIYHDQNELAKYQAELKKVESLRYQLEEINEQLNAQNVVAERAGTVFARGIENDLHRFYQHGDVILTIANDDAKHIIVSISEDDIDSLKTRSDQPVHMSFSGVPIFQSRFKLIKPRASDQLTEPALGASAGGPLPIKTVSDENGDPQPKLLRPRFVAELEISSEFSSLVCAGQTGEAFVKVENESLGIHLFARVRSWLAEKLNQAASLN